MSRAGTFSLAASSLASDQFFLLRRDLDIIGDGNVDLESRAEVRGLLRQRQQEAQSGSRGGASRLNDIPELTILRSA